MIPRGFPGNELARSALKAVRIQTPGHLMLLQPMRRMQSHMASQGRLTKLPTQLLRGPWRAVRNPTEDITDLLAVHHYLRQLLPLLQPRHCTIGRAPAQFVPPALSVLLPVLPIPPPLQSTPPALFGHPVLHALVSVPNGLYWLLVGVADNLKALGFQRLQMLRKLAPSRPH